LRRGLIFGAGFDYGRGALALYQQTGMVYRDE
jgi:hypothetical protein